MLNISLLGSASWIGLHTVIEFYNFQSIHSEWTAKRDSNHPSMIFNRALGLVHPFGLLEFVVVFLERSNNTLLSLFFKALAG